MKARTAVADYRENVPCKWHGSLLLHQEYTVVFVYRTQHAVQLP